MESQPEELCSAIARRIESLRSYSLTQLRECRGPMSLHVELSTEIKQDIATVDGLLEVRIIDTASHAALQVFGKAELKWELDWYSMSA